MNNKEILIVTNNYPSKYSKRAGVFSKQDADFFLELGNNVTVLVANRYILSPKQLVKSIFDLNIRELKKVADLDTKSDLKLKVIRYFSFPKPYVFFEDLFVRFLPIKLKRSFDIVLLEFMIEPGLLIKWIKRNIHSKKYILREHSDWCRYPILMQKACVANLKYFDQVLVNSAFMRSNITKLINQFNVNDFDTNRILIDFPKFHINDKVVEKESNKKYSFLTVANLILQKGYFEMIDLIALLVGKGYDIKWIIVGKGFQKSEISEYALRKGIRNVITFLEEKLQHELAELYTASNFYIQMTHYETFGIAPIEAYTYQCKLIVSDVIPSLNELVCDNDNILKIKKDPTDAFLTVLEAFINKPFDLGTFSQEIKKIKAAISSSPF